jgi:4-carboxymuconolactone decarboxylase
MDTAPDPSAAPRLAPIPLEGLDDDQRAVLKIVAEGRRAAESSTLHDEQGGLVGPFNSFLYRPLVGRHLAELGELVRFDTLLPRRLVEVAVLTVAAHWRSNFEWWAHARYARRFEVADEVIEAIGRGEQPVFERDDESVVHRFSRQLLDDGRADDEAYAAALQLLGDPGVVELVDLVGYYCVISLILNAFRVPVPRGEELRWPA